MGGAHRAVGVVDLQAARERLGGAAVEHKGRAVALEELEERLVGEAWAAHEHAVDVVVF